MAYIALLLTLGLIAWLLSNDFHWRRLGSKALLIPGIWLTIQGSRPLSYWFDWSGESNVDGNPINTFAFAAMIGASLYILRNRRLDWGTLFTRNKAVFVFYLFFALSSIWSEMHFISLKRIFKDFGCVLVGLIFLTEKNPAEAIRGVFVRVACVLFPLSLVFGRFFPLIGRNYTKDGEPMFTGVATQKNSLGEMLFVLGLMVLWDLYETWKMRPSAKQRKHMYALGGLMLLCVVLLRYSDSQTSFLCLLLGTAAFFGGAKLATIPNGRRILVTCLVLGIGVVALDKTFNLSAVVIKALGRNPDLTGRKDIWRLVLEKQDNAMLGQGFCVFWDTEKGQDVIGQLMRINSTHNGYLEMYMDGGWVADGLLLLLLLTGGKRVIDRLFRGDPLGKIGLVIWLTAIIYNFSESSFFRLDNLWFTLLLVIIYCPQRFRRGAAVAASGPRVVAMPA
jgi:O-antigen ligase